jgi:SPP1 gp7 family putative phage head morphogenesis protein
MKRNFKPNRMTEKRYAAAIERIMKGLEREMAHAESPFQMLSVLRGLARSPTFEKACEDAARSMATHAFSDGHRTWREAARAGSKGRRIYRLLNGEFEANDIYWDIVSRNSRLIQSMTNEAAERVSNIVSEGQSAGIRSEDMIDDILRQWPTMTRTHAKLIARTESSKSASALTRSRAQSAGLNWYIWETSEDSRVRSSHRHMDGVLVNWNDPPSPEALIDMKDYGKYHAGEFPNCRCYAAPLIEYDDVSWPHKVYRNGRIRYMRLSEFKKIEGG